MTPKRKRAMARRVSWSIGYLQRASVGRYGGAVAAKLRWGVSRIGHIVRSVVEWVVTTTRLARRSSIVAGGRPPNRLWMT
jgi:hypothetical protein